MIEPSDLISPAYLEEQRILHASPRGYGQRGHKWAPKVSAVAWTYGCTSILDYGCGQGALAQSLKMASHVTDIREYDPAIAEKSALPEMADCVVCTDVLEHVEIDKIGAVLLHLWNLTRKVAFVVVSLVETSKTLTDGRQAHILLRTPEWWANALRHHGFLIVETPQVKPDKQWVAVLRA